MVARREHSSAEASAALLRKGYDAEAVATTIAELQQERLLDDARYAESLVRMLTGRGAGGRSVCAMPCSRPASPPRPPRQRSKPHPTGCCWRQMFAAANSEPEYPRTGQAGHGRCVFLQYRGFSKDHIASALGGSGADDPELAETSPDDS